MSVRQGRLLITLLAVMVASIAQGQATRTWVSGVGDDVNPCSRTAPCKTFAGAISKTAIGGEISALDPGGFGAVTITKAMTINGDGTLAGILAAGTNGVIINAPATAAVVLRNISINGAGNGFDGVRVLAAKSLLIDSCTIYNFTQEGVEIAAGASIPVQILNTRIFNVTGSAVLSNTTIGTINLSISNSFLGHSGKGLNTKVGTIATVSHSTVMNNTTGLHAENASIINVDRNQISSNGTGILSLNNGSVVRLFGNFIQNNSVAGFNVTATSTIVSAGNNSIQTSPGNVGTLGTMGQQ